MTALNVVSLIPLPAGATVDGTFSGDINEGASGVTNGSGTVTLETTGFAQGGVNVSFCVDDVTGGPSAYDAAENVESCDSN